MSTTSLRRDFVAAKTRLLDGQKSVELTWIMAAEMREGGVDDDAKLVKTAATMHTNKVVASIVRLDLKLADVIRGSEGYTWTKCRNTTLLKYFCGKWVQSKRRRHTTVS